METKVRPFNVNKTFGIDVLLKLTKARLTNIEAFEDGGKYTFNVSAEELNRAINETLLNHNISLLVN